MFEPKLWRVHCFCVVRHVIEAVPARNAKAAIAAVTDTPLEPDWYEKFNLDESTAYGEEIIEYLVDRVGDTQYEHTQAFYAAEHPAMRLLIALKDYDLSMAGVPLSLQDDIQALMARAI